MDRFWEIDMLRGMAIVLMIIFHSFYDLNFIGRYSIDLYSGFWWMFARIIASIFILLVGISLTISYSRQKTGFRKYLRRGLKIFSYGLLITLSTWFFLKEGFIVFGILHFIGLSIIIAFPFLRYRLFNMFLGIFFIITGIFLQAFTFDFPYLLWLGFLPDNFYTIDYFPILPWFGLILLGLFIGNIFYPGGKRSFAVEDLSRFRIISFFSFLGRHSLLLYLLHQPVIIALLYIFVLQ